MNSDIQGYEVFQDAKEFKKAFERLPKAIQEVLNEKIKFLAKNPDHNSLNTKAYYCSAQVKKRLQSQGIDDVREFYINGKKYRCIFYVLHQRKMLYLVMVGTHDQLKNWSK